MKRFTTSILALAVLGAPLVAACGDDETSNPGPGVDTIFPDAVGDTTNPGPDGSNPQIVKAFDFEQAFGDDQRPCRSQDRCAIFISFTERRTLQLKYTEDGAATAGQVVKFAIENDQSNLGFINTLSAVTDASGIAQVETRAREGRVGQFVVKAWIDGTNLPAKYFDVVVSPKGQVPLTVVGSYNGTRAVGTYGVRLYRQTNAVPGCDDLLDLYENGTASQARDNVLLNQSAKFPDFDNLEADGKQRYTILLVATNQAGAIIAWGCDAVQGEVEWGLSKTVQVELADRPPNYAGAYQVTSYFDFISAIPEPYQTYVRAVLRIFENPLDGLLDLVCGIIVDAQGQSNAFCDNVAGDNVLADVIKDVLNDILIAFLPPSVQNVFQTGADIGKLLQAFEVDETLTIRNEPDEFGNFQPGDITHTWNATRFRWRLNQGCPPDSTTCGVTQIGFAALGLTGGQTISGSAAGRVENTWDLVIDTHPVNLKYGLLLSAMLEKVVFPLVTGTQDSDNQVDSYEEILGMLFGGGTECLTGAQTCCEIFSENVSNQASLRSAAKAGCDAVVALVPATLDQLLGGLEVNSEEAFTLATKMACPLEDSDNDMTVDLVGTNANRCQWQANLRFGANAATSIDASFWGLRQ